MGNDVNIEFPFTVRILCLGFPFYDFVHFKKKYQNKTFISNPTVIARIYILNENVCHINT